MGKASEGSVSNINVLSDLKTVISTEVCELPFLVVPQDSVPVTTKDKALLVVSLRNW